MLIGLFAGILYCKYMYNKQGNKPSLKINLKLQKLEIKDGMIFYKKRHIHHWMICLGVIPIVMFLGLEQVKWFCVVLTVNGLSYDDRLD